MVIPTGHRVLVKLDPVKQKSDGGIILYTDDKESQHRTGVQRGLVLAVGPSAWKAFREVSDGKEFNGRPWAETGDYVLFARHAGRFIEDPFQETSNGDLIMMNDEDIVAILTEGKNETPSNPHRRQIVDEEV